MAFQGYFIKVGGYIFPLKYMKAGTYTAYRNVQDLDDYTDADGVLHRNALDHVPCKAEFETSPMTGTEWDELMTNIQSNYTNVKERKANVTVFIPEIGGYVTQEMYVPNMTPKITQVINGDVIYDANRLAFIGY